MDERAMTAASEGGDRRVRRTIRAIDEAFLSLMHRKPFAKITLAEVAHEADISRATFYVYYQDKYAWMEGYLDRLISRMFPRSGPGAVTVGFDEEAGPDQMAMDALDELDRNFDTYALILRNSGSDLFQRRLKPRIADSVAAVASIEGVGLSAEQRELIVQVLSSAMTGAIAWWIEQDRPLGKRELVDTFISVRRLALELESR